MLMSTRSGYKLRSITLRNGDEIKPGDHVLVSPRSDFASDWDATYVGAHPDHDGEIVLKSAETGIRTIVSTSCNLSKIGNPIIRRTRLRAYPGWIVREFADGMFDAIDTNSVAMSPGERSFADALYFVKHGEPAPLA